MDVFLGFQQMREREKMESNMEQYHPQVELH